MTITLHTSRGELTGPSIPVIVATEWGPDARFSGGRDGYLGNVIEQDPRNHRAWHVLGKITSAATPDGDIHYMGGEWMELYLGDPMSGVRAATEHLMTSRATAEDADRAWRASIRAALADGQRAVDIAEAAGISRERVYQIRDGRRT